MKTDAVRKFIFSIGGYPGPYFYFELKDGVLSCEYSPDTSTPSKVTFFPVSENENWKQLLTYLSLKKWKADYGDPMTIDGTLWSLEVAFENRMLCSGGQNGYPPGFCKFLRLLNSVTMEKGVKVC
ncbi:MAG: hypothetical protein EOO14_05550 [Chitinophagaceae bacterium]|nr:MAG: hypothetical protein EOO14_05550 [Chitinophagaceae bacterium]